MLVWVIVTWLLSLFGLTGWVIIGAVNFIGIGLTLVALIWRWKALKH
jgi:hypothetical protein